MRWHAFFIVLIYRSMGHFMHVGNQKSVRIQIGIYRNLRLIIRKRPKITQTCLAGLSNLKVGSYTVAKAARQ